MHDGTYVGEDVHVEMETGRCCSRQECYGTGYSSAALSPSHFIQSHDPYSSPNPYISG